MDESGLLFSEEEIDNLSNALFDETDQNDNQQITFDELKNQFKRHDGLLEQLVKNMQEFLVPPKPKVKAKNTKMKTPQQLTMNYWRNNKALVSWAFIFIGVCIAMFIHRAYQFKDSKYLGTGFFGETSPNMLSVISRACGEYSFSWKFSSFNK